MFKSVVPTIGLVLTPFYIASLVITLLYRFICHLWLKCTRPDYEGLLDILEALFEGENSSNLSIVNVFVKLKPAAELKNGEDLRRCLVEKVNKLASKKDNIRSICVVDKRFGLRFWRREKTNMEEQVIPFNASNSKDVEDYLSTVANVPIRNKRLFELHVGLQLVDGKYPMIFRAHHSMGDGYAMRQFILEEQVTHSRCHNSISKSSTANGKSSWGVFKKKVALGVDILQMFIHAPTLCIEQYLVPRDKNSLKADVLSGEKILRYREGELQKIKDIQNVTNSTFKEILLSAMSKSLDNLFKARGESVPYVTIFFPARKTQESSGLANEFIPIGFQLPVSTPNREIDIMEKIRQVNSLPAYKSIHYLPRFAFLLYPMDLPNWVYKCTELTGVFSNVPGPKQKVAFKEFELEEVTFFLPNLLKDNALGVMVTSYVDKFTCSVIIDRTVTQSDDDAQKIVDGIMDYLFDAHKRLCQKAN